MRFYLVVIEGRDLQIPDGPIGFFASRFVLASSETDAERRAHEMTLRTFRRWASFNDLPPTLATKSIAPVGLIHGLRCLRQNRGHTFYVED